MDCSAKHIGGSSPVTSIRDGTADADLFNTIASNPNHSLYQILPKFRPNQYSLRKRGHLLLRPLSCSSFMLHTSCSMYFYMLLLLRVSVLCVTFMYSLLSIYFCRAMRCGVRLSVCLSRSYILLKRINVSLTFFTVG